MMKRRKFLKTAGAVSVVLSAGTLYAYNYLPDKEVKMYPPDELKAALEKHFNEILDGKNFNPEVLPPNGKMMVTKSYSIVINNQKNSIFDIADLMIDKLKKFGYDASSLKKGEMPEGLGIGSGTVQIPGRMFPVRIEELMNYDATLSLSNYSMINTQVPPSEWKKIQSFKEEVNPSGMHIYTSTIDNKPVFKLSNMPNREKPFEFRFNVSRIDPMVVIEDNISTLILDFSQIEPLFSDNILETINIC